MCQVQKKLQMQQEFCSAVVARKQECCGKKIYLFFADSVRVRTKTSKIASASVSAKCCEFAFRLQTRLHLHISGLNTATDKQNTRLISQQQ